MIPKRTSLKKLDLLKKCNSFETSVDFCDFNKRCLKTDSA